MALTEIVDAGSYFQPENPLKKRNASAHSCHGRWGVPSVNGFMHIMDIRKIGDEILPTFHTR